MDGWIFYIDFSKDNAVSKTKPDPKWECARCGLVVSGYGMNPPETCPNHGTINSH
jgi:rubrerythrin